MMPSPLIYSQFYPKTLNGIVIGEMFVFHSIMEHDDFVRNLTIRKLSGDDSVLCAGAINIITLKHMSGNRIFAIITCGRGGWTQHVIPSESNSVEVALRLAKDKLEDIWDKVQKHQSRT